MVGEERRRGLRGPQAWGKGIRRPRTQNREFRIQKSEGTPFVSGRAVPALGSDQRRDASATFDFWILNFLFCILRPTSAPHPVRFAHRLSCFSSNRLVSSSTPATA